MSTETKQNMHNPMRKKILSAFLGVVVLTLLIIGIFVAYQVYMIRSEIISSNEATKSSVQKQSGYSISEQIKEKMRTLARSKADLSDATFQNFGNEIEIVADAVTELYNHREEYAAKTVDPPMMENADVLAVQIMYSENTDPSSRAIMDEAGLLGNMASVLYSINNNSPSMASNYIATDSGIMIQADQISQNKFDADGNVLPYEAATRPWFKGAKETGNKFFTPATKDIHTGRVGVMCGVPFYEGDTFMGVSGAGMYLDDVKKAVMETKIGETGYALIVNSDGKIVFSSAQDGELSVDSNEGMDDMQDMRQCSNDQLRQVIRNAVLGNASIEYLDVNEQPVYMAYAPMSTIGWTFITVLPEEEMIHPTKELLASLDNTLIAGEGRMTRRINSAGITILVVAALVLVGAVLASLVLSSHIVEPILMLTKKVKTINGENLDFSWDLNTGDETQVLAESFGTMTEQTKRYIADITSITAEKERIGAELSVASQIQEDMLPSTFPAFPDRKDFDIYATMNPAKEVGGDFYDFFMVDDTHLAIVMADVSGKGVPAALFMVISKTLLKTRAMMGGSVSEIMSHVNNQLCEGNKADMFVTVWMGILDLTTGQVTCGNAGHEYPALRGANGNFELMKGKHSFVMGGMEGIKYKEQTFTIEPGGTFYIYTDGVPEATNKQDELYGTDRMLDALNQNPAAAPAELLKTVKDSADAFVGDAPQFDDMTMLALTYWGPAGKPEA